MPDARLVLKRLGYTMKSRERYRRPTLVELDKVLEHFFEMLARRSTVIHMPKVVAFAIFSTRIWTISRQRIEHRGGLTW